MYRNAKFVVAGLAIGFFAGVVGAQWKPPSVESRRAAYERKWAKPFATKLPWIRTIREAKVASRRTRKFIIAYVTPCYCACPVSDALENGPLVSEWWLRRAREFPLYLNIEARIADLPDQRFLRTQEGYYSYPWLFFVNQWGRGISAVDTRSEAAFDASLELARVTANQMRLVAQTSGGKAAKAGLALCRAFFKRTDSDIADYDALAATPGLDPEVKALYQQRRHELVEKSNVYFLNQMMREFARSPLPPASVYRKRSETFYEYYRKGIRIPVDQNPSFQYCEALIHGAVWAADKKTTIAYYEVAKSRVERMHAFFRQLMEYEALYEHGHRSINEFSVRLARLQRFLRENGLLE